MTGAVLEAGAQQPLASMRPRLIAVDDLLRGRHDQVLREASMRPRLIAVDDFLRENDVTQDNDGFNEATAYCRG